MPTYRVPLVWQLYGHVHVTAETKEAAIEYALGPECPLPPGDYVTDSVAVDEDIEVEAEQRCQIGRLGLWKFRGPRQR